MAATCPPESAPSEPADVVIKTESEWGEEVLSTPWDVPLKREPVVPLMSRVCGLQPLRWSSDHRLAVCTSGSLSVIELRCDVRSSKLDLSLSRTSIPVPAETHRLEVNNHGKETVENSTASAFLAAFCRYATIYSKIFFSKV